jgi:hypothetical protein
VPSKLGWLGSDVDVELLAERKHARGQHGAKSHPQTAAEGVSQWVRLGWPCRDE